MSNAVARHRPMLLVVSALALVGWGAVGLYQGLHRGFSGGLYDPDYVVRGVLPGSAAERAGFQPGDRIISVDGIRIEKLGMESRWPRSLASRISQSRRFIVRRDAEVMALNCVYSAPSQNAVNNRVGAAIVGLGFLCVGLWTFLSERTPPATLLGYIGLAAAVAMSLGLGPTLGTWNGVMGHVSTAATVLLFILLLRFFETFPKPKPLSESRTATWAIYLPWLGLLVFLCLELIVHPVLGGAVVAIAGEIARSSRCVVCLRGRIRCRFSLFPSPWRWP